MSDEIGNTGEVWKTISEAPKYSVSTMGRVRRDADYADNIYSRWKPGMILKPCLRVGYQRVALLNEHNQRINRQVSRLMAIAFLTPDPTRPFVNHKNGIRNDDRIDNLEWVTHQENIMHACHVLGRPTPFGESHGNAKLNDDAVRKIRELLKQPIKQRDIASMFGVHQRVVWMIKHDLLWRHVA